MTSHASIVHLLLKFTKSPHNSKKLLNGFLTPKFTQKKNFIPETKETPLFWALLHCGVLDQSLFVYLEIARGKALIFFSLAGAAEFLFWTQKFVRALSIFGTMGAST